MSWLNIIVTTSRNRSCLKFIKSANIYKVVFPRGIVFDSYMGLSLFFYICEDHFTRMPILKRVEQRIGALTENFSWRILCHHLLFRLLLIRVHCWKLHSHLGSEVFWRLDFRLHSITIYWFLLLPIYNFRSRDNVLVFDRIFHSKLQFKLVFIILLFRLSSLFTTKSFGLYRCPFIARLEMMENFITSIVIGAIQNWLKMILEVIAASFPRPLFFTIRFVVNIRHLL